MRSHVHDRNSLAVEIAAAIDGRARGEITVRWNTRNGRRVVELTQVSDWSSETRSDTSDLVCTPLFGPAGLSPTQTQPDPLLPVAIQLGHRLELAGSQISAEVIRRDLRVGPKRSRRLRDAVQVRQILRLIDQFGYDAVNLKEVRTRLGLAKTSAYYRLTEARALWNQEHANAKETTR